MIELHYWPTPNGHKVAMMLEECGLPYEIHPVDIGAGDQFKPGFLAIAPNNRMPAIVDRDPQGGGAPLSVFESGAILLYLAEKTGRFLPNDLRGRMATIEWLFWQMGGLGPMSGQNFHFTVYAPERLPYAVERYANETNRLYGVLERRLARCAFVSGDDYGVADMACHPWIVPWERLGQRLSDFPNLERWFDAVAARAATVEAYRNGEALNRPAAITDEQRRMLFGQTAASTAR